MFSPGAFYLAGAGLVQVEVCLHPPTIPRYFDLDVLRQHLLGCVSSPALGIEFELAAAGDRSQLPPFEKDFVLVGFNRLVIARHEMKQRRPAATGTFHDQDANEYENADPSDRRC